MRTIKIYFKRAPFYNALTRSWDYRPFLYMHCCRKSFYRTSSVKALFHSCPRKSKMFSGMVAAADTLTRSWDYRPFLYMHCCRKSFYRTSSVKALFHSCPRKSKMFSGMVAAADTSVTRINIPS
jgi:type IV secretory pathway TrbD component